MSLLLARALLLLGALALIGCTPYRIEYRKRPAYYQRMVDEPLPDRVVLEDGTVIVYNADEDPGPAAESGGKLFQIREQQDDGTIVLKALLPEHVLGNTLTCLRRQEYELLWDELLSERTKLAYAEKGMGVDEFSTYMRKHRMDLARTMNRMLRGAVAQDLVVEGVGNGVIECRLWPQVASQFKFRKVSMVYEDLNLKLLLVQ